MSYPQLFLIPVLMLIDYWLTVVGARLHTDKYAQHIKTFGYELNPLLQKDIEKKRPFSARHLAAVALVTGLLIGFNLITTEQETIDIRFVLGLVFGFYALIIGRHLSNILTFRYANRHPDSMQGEIKYSMGFLYHFGAYETVNFAPLFALLLWQMPGPFIYGLAVGAIIFGMQHFNWLRQMKSNDRRNEKNE